MLNSSTAASQRKENPPKTSIQTKKYFQTPKTIKNCLQRDCFSLISYSEPLPVLWTGRSSTGINFRWQRRTRQRQAKRPSEGHTAYQWRAATTHNEVQPAPYFTEELLFIQKEGVIGPGWFSRVVTKPGVSEPLERRASHLVRIRQEVRTTFFSSSMSPKLDCPKVAKKSTILRSWHLAPSLQSK